MDESRSAFCPRCQLEQATFEFAEAGQVVRRCEMCGFPVDAGLSLDDGGAKVGLPEPPTVKVLVVDDDPIICRTMEEILGLRGYSVATAPDGEAGLEAVRREQPALLLLDVMMPKLDGFEVCRRMKADPATRKIPIIILTAMAGDDLTLNARAFAAGAELALRKPANTPLLLRTIEAALSLASVRAAGAVAADLSLPTNAVPLEFWTVDGTFFKAELALHLQAEGHVGPETVQDRLNDPDLFLTLTVPGELHPVFLNKIQVVRVDVAEAEWAADFVATPGEVSIQMVRVQLINGEQLTGRVRIEGPAGRRRLSDFLNTQPTFLPLLGKDRLHLLHKRCIARVVPQVA